MNGSSAWFDKDFYAVLGVPENATADEIKRAYKKLATENHPDRNPGNAAAEERMKDVSEAYAVLKDAAKRSEYDQIRRMSRAGYGPGGRGPGGPAGWGGAEGVPFDLGDLFGSMFGGARARGPQRGADLETRVTLSFEDAFHGVTVPVRLTRDVACEACAGTGDASRQARPCPSCGGSGMTAENQGMFSFARACPSCGGSGRVVADPCRACRGAGVARATETVKVKIPAGINDGARVRIRGRGGASPGGPSGDLFVVVRVEPHPLFGRSGRDLTLTMPVSYPAAALGAAVKVPTMNGPVTLKVPAGTQPGKTFRVRGKGVPGTKGAGDLLVTVQVEVPKKISKEERGLLEQLAAIRSDGGSDG